MGKVRTETVKRISRALVLRFPDKFGTDYEANKQIIDQVVDARSKKLRNRIVGYVTRLKKIEQQVKASMEELSKQPAVEAAEEVS